MDSFHDVLVMLRMWGSFFGLIFGSVGACLLFVGIKAQLSEAKLLEEFISAQLNKVTWDSKLDNAITVRDMRAKERRQAKNTAILGLIFFVVGSMLQAFTNFPIK